MANIKVEIDANINTKLLTLSFQRSARTRISPMSIIKNGTRDIKSSALVRNTLFSIYVKATTKESYKKKKKLLIEPFDLLSALIQK